MDLSLNILPIFEFATNLVSFWIKTLRSKNEAKYFGSHDYSNNKPIKSDLDESGMLFVKSGFFTAG
jgi:hypothetical protein